MRVLFTTCPAHGHLNPMVPLARATVAAGHEVRIATSASFAPQVERAGLTPQVAGLDWLESAPEIAFPEFATLSQRERAMKIGQIFWAEGPRPMARDLLALFETWRPDVVVAEYTEAGGSLAAEVAGIPFASFEGLIPMIASPKARPTDPEERARLEETLGRNEYPRLRAELGLPPRDWDDALDTFMVLDQCPPSLHLLGPRFVMRHPQSLRPIPWNPPAPDSARHALDGIDPGRPLVHVTLGTVLRGMDRVLRTIIDGCAHLDAHVLVSTSEVAALGSLPANTTAVPFVDHGVVLPRCALVVHHGGGGTTVACLAAGVPQLLIPQAADQPRNAMRVRSVGAGRYIPAPALSVDGVRENVTELLGEDLYARNAQRLRHEIEAMPSPGHVVRALERLAETREPVRPAAEFGPPVSTQELATLARTEPEPA